MKKYIFLAASALTLASCSSDDFVGTEGGNVVNGANKAINFGGETGKITRADSEGEAAATLLDNNFVVVGFKSNETAAANTGLVFDHYNVNYVTGTANTTASNTKDWEYVGQDQNVKGLGKKLANNNTTAQTIKYWDNSYTSYDFLAFSMGKGYPGDGSTNKYATPTAVNKDNLKNAAYTLTGDVNTLGECYISNMVTVAKGDKGYKNEAVNMQFRHASSKVRIALYETVPGYVISDVKFHTDSYNSNGEYTEGQTKGVLYGTFNNAGTLTVLFPTTGTENKNNSDYNKAHVSFLPQATNGTVNKVEFGEVSYECQKEDHIADKSKYLSQSAAKPSYCGGYINVLPAETNSSPANLRIDYKLTATDGSDEEINVKNATATVPKEYTAWKHGYAYTYIFKISENTNGTTGTPSTDDQGLTAISFNAVVLDDEETGKQETITTVSDPSITTYAKGEINNEYKTKYNIYVSVNNTTELHINSGNTDSTPTNVKLFTATGTGSYEKNITEATVALCLSKGTTTATTDERVLSVDDKNKLTVTPATGLSIVSEIAADDAVDGNAISGNFAKFTPDTAGTYVFEFTDTNNTKYYKVIIVK